MAFDSGVATPPTSAYGPPQVDMSWIGNLLNKYAQGQQQKFAQDQRDLVTQQQEAFKGGVPTDANGNPDYRAITQMLAQKGDINAIAQLAPFVQVQNSGQVSPVTAQLLGLPPQGNAQPQAAPNGAPAPASVPARATAPAAGGGDQAGSLTDLVSTKLPDAQAGPVIARIAQTMGVDANTALTPGQQRRAAGLLTRYAASDAPQTGAGATAAPAGSATARVDTSFPPSAGAVTPAPQQRAWPQPAWPQQTPAQQSAAQPRQPAQQPLVPQVPLPLDPRTGQRFTDPQAAIQAIDTALIGERNPQAAAALKNYRDRIEASIQPVKIGGNDTIVDPRTGAVIARGTQAAAAANTEAFPTLDADAERYRQTGQLPPNMGRGIQGQQQATAIRTRAVQQEIDEGGNPKDWPTRWQQFATTAVGRRVLQQRAANLTLAENESTTLIPRVREASANVSRTQYPSLNKIIEAAQKGSGDPNIIKLGIAAASLIPVYARVLKPTGQITEGDTARAGDILDKAWSDGQINAALDQMQVELKSARTALNKTLKEYGTRDGGDDTSAPATAPATNNNAPPAPPSGFTLVH